MRNPKFEVFIDAAREFRFRLKAVNGEITLSSSEGYTSKQSCLGGITSVKANAPYDFRYHRGRTSDYQYYFTLKASNGEVLGKSESYSTSSAMENGIGAVKRDAPSAPIDDLTIASRMAY